MDYVIGIDEVGRGPIAGPVVVCACAIIKGIDVVSFFPKQKLKDSKKLSEKRRLEILNKIEPHVRDKNILFGIGEVSAQRIDKIGISPSIKEAMVQALDSLHLQGVDKISFVFLDGSLKAPDIYLQETIIKGDEKIPEIALASIYAKEYRDSLMREHGKRFTQYNFDKHVGYGTKAHYAAIKEYGTTELHRLTFLKSVIG